MPGCVAGPGSVPVAGPPVRKPGTLPGFLMHGAQPTATLSISRRAKENPAKLRALALHPAASARLRDSAHTPAIPATQSQTRAGGSGRQPARKTRHSRPSLTARFPAPQSKSAGMAPQTLLFFTLPARRSAKNARVSCTRNNALRPPVAGAWPGAISRLHTDPRARGEKTGGHVWKLGSDSVQREPRHTRCRCPRVLPRQRQRPGSQHHS